MTTPGDATPTIDFDSLRAGYLQTQLGGDRRAALRMIEEALRSGASADDVRSRIIQAAQREIGTLWQEDRISVAQEHMATAISQLALAHVFPHARFRAAVGRKVLIACVRGEHHDFPARMLADALDSAGYEVRFLGADVPLDSLLQAIEAEQPDLVALSATMMFNLPALRQTVSAVRARSAVPIAVGGHALDGEDGGAGIGADLVAGPGTQLLHELDGLLGVRA